MEANGWLIGQIIIDIIMAILLLWFLIFNYRRRRPAQHFEETFHKSEIILSEMRDISHSLEKNLEEKRELGRHIIEQIDEGLKRAEESYRQVQEIIKIYGGNITFQPLTLKDAGQARRSVNGLLSKGLTREEVARHLGISVSEIELLLKLQSQADSSSFLEND